MTLTQPAWGQGLATLTESGQVLDVWFPTGKLALGRPEADGLALGRPEPDGPALGRPEAGSLALGRPGAGEDVPPNVTLTPAQSDTLLGLPAGTAGPRALPGLHTAGILVTIESLAEPPRDTFDIWLRLHLLSHRLIRPHDANLAGTFGLLTNVAWTSAGPCPPERVDELRIIERAAGRHLAVYGVDKFPRMTDYVVPSGVRIADADRVRLGAHLAVGTTVMHEGFVNFNAGTLGVSMVEGRIVAGVVVGDGSDIGAGASIMGTLSGGGTEVIRIGERCLLGANAGTGISLGDDTVVEAGCYLTAGSKVTLPDGRTVKARELSGVPGLLFWRNSVTGALEARPRSGAGIQLNTALHTNS